jgi:hypothetical protein
MLNLAANYTLMNSCLIEPVELQDEWPRRLVHSGEELDSLADYDYGSVEYRTKGFSLANPLFVNRYLHKELYILVRFRIWEVAEDYIACFQRVCRPSGFSSVKVGSVNSCHSLQLTKGRLGHVDMLSDAPVVNESTTRNQKAVLVNIVKAMEPPEHEIPSLVWFDRADKIHSLFPYSFYFSTERFLLFWGGRDVIGDWKTGVDSRSVAVGPNQGASQIVESTPEILENVSRHKTEFVWNDEILRQTIERLLCIRVALYNDGVWMRVCEPAKGKLEVSEVMLGPLCF